MADNITSIIIQIKAQSAEAAAQLKDFVAQTSDGLKELNVTGTKTFNILDAVRDGFDRQAARQKYATDAAYSDFQRLNTGGSAAMGALEKNIGSSVEKTGLHIAGLTYYVRGGIDGIRYAAAGGGLRAAFYALDETFRGLFMSGAGLSTVLPIIGTVLAGLTPLIIDGAVAWSTYKARQNEAATAAAEFAQTQSLIATNLDRIAEAQKRGLINPNDYAFIEKLLLIGTDSALKSAQRHMASLGIGGSFEDYDKLKTLERELHESVMEHFDQESAKSWDNYEKRLDEIRKLAATGGMTAPEAHTATEEAMAEYNSKQASIEAERQKKAFADVQQAYADSQIKIISAADAGKQKREGFTKEEFENEIIRLHDLQQKYPLAEDEMTKALTAAIEKRNAGIRSEVLTEKEKTAEYEKQKQLKLQAARDDSEAKLKAIESNPLLTSQQKSQQSVAPLQDLIGDNNTYIADMEKDQKKLNTDSEAYLELQTKINAAKQQQVDYENKLQAAQGQNSIVYQTQVQLTSFLSSVQNTASDVAKLAMSPFIGMQQGLQSALTKMIEYGGTAKQFFQSIALSIGQSMIGAFAKMVSDWIMSHVVMAAVSKIFNLQEVAGHMVSETTKTVITTTATGQRIMTRTVETVTATAQTGIQVGAHAAGEAAKTSLTATGGGSRGIIGTLETAWHAIQTAIKVAIHFAGETAMTGGTLAGALIRHAIVFAELQPYIILTALEAAASVAAIPGYGWIAAIPTFIVTLAALEGLAAFAGGGLVTGPGTGTSDSVPARLSTGEFVIPASRVRQMGVPFLESIRSGSLSNITASGGASHINGSGSGGSGGGDARPVNVKLVPVYDARAAALEMLNSAAGEKAVVMHVKNNKTAMGFQT